jgi:hypothetical protein
MISPDPVAHFARAVALEALDVAGHGAVEEDGPDDDRAIGQDPRPVLHERIALPGREGSHTIGHRITLILEEDRQVRFQNLSQLDLGQPLPLPGLSTSLCGIGFEVSLPVGAARTMLAMTYLRVINACYP